MEIRYEVSDRAKRQFKWKIHTLRCADCQVKAVVVIQDREKTK